MWMEADHIDKDAQDLSRVIVGTRPTRPVQRAAIAHSYIQNYNEYQVSPAPIRALRLSESVCMLIVRRQCIVRFDANVFVV